MNGTYADLRDGDLLRSKDGRDYPVSAVRHDPAASRVTFVVASKHTVTKPRTDPAVITRTAPDPVTSELAKSDLAVKAAQDGLGATVLAVTTLAEEKAAASADVTVIPLRFEDMTDLERRTHLFVFHQPGFWPKDVTSRAELIADHAAQHQVPGSKMVPHVHKGD